MKYFFFFFLFINTTLLTAQEPQYKTIIVGSFLTPTDALAEESSFKAWAMQKVSIRELKKRQTFYFVTRASGSYWIVALEPLQDESTLNQLFKVVKTKYHDAFIANIRSPKLLSAYRSQLQVHDVTEEENTRTVEEEQYIKIPKEDETRVEIEYVQMEDNESFSTIVKLTIGLLFLTILIVVLLLRQRRSLKNEREFENLVSDLNSSNSELVTENRGYEGSIKEQEEFIEEMSVKLKDPAKSILGRTERILETSLSDKQSIELRNIQDSGQVLFAIVDDLLDFMKIRSSKLEIKAKPFDINELLDLIVHSVLDRIEKKDVEVIFDIEKSVPPRIIGDPIRIGQVLTNLLENGIKFTNSGEVKLHVKAITKTEEKIQLMFEIIDTGIGIPESKLDDIFTPFYQIMNNNNAGLGLSISKALIEMMGGEILVSTEVNRGSTFTFVLGLKEVDVNEKRHYRLPDSAYKARDILLLDDHESAASALQHLLTYFHNKVTIYAYNDEAVLPDLSKYEMVFVSEKLLTFDLIKKIAQIKASKAIKIVVVSSMLHKMNNSNLIEKLADARLMKPVNQQNIFDLLVDFYGDNVKPLPADVKEKNSPSPSTPRIVIARTQKEDVHKEDFVVFAGANVLIAEDNIINQKVLMSLLKESGIHLDLADNGKIAFDMAQSKKYDLVLMDMHMPVMDGYEATERLKSSVVTAELPVVAVSGDTMPDEVKKMHACGVDDRLEKPIKVQALYSAFGKYLEVHAVEDASKVNALPDRLFMYEEALERCGGDTELYKELVEEFIKLYKNSDELLQQYVAQKESAKLKNLSLDIKGVSSNIGVYALANASQTINESSISSSSMAKHLKNYKAVLEKSLDALIAKMQSI